MVVILQSIKKRDGRVVDFDQSRIESAIFKSLEACAVLNRGLAKKLAAKAVEKLAKRHRKIKKIPMVEEVQDLVEETLIEAGYAKIAKAYILYRQKRTEIRREKASILNKREEDVDEIDKKFDINALRVLASRYLRKDENGKIIESPKELFTRVAITIGLADLLHDNRVYKKPLKAVSEIKHNPEYKPLDIVQAAKLEERFAIGKYRLNKFHISTLHLAFHRFQHNGLTKILWDDFVEFFEKNAFQEYEKNIDEYRDLMVGRRFMPGTPTLANFGSNLGMGSSCFVLEVKDSIHSIMETLKDTALIHQAGGGTGFYFGNLRPEGDMVKSTSGVASGPISFMRLYDFLTEVIKQGGMRRGANMGILPSDHPDIEKFITAKHGNKALRNFNISVLIKPEFWDAYKEDKPYPLVNPRNGAVVSRVSARDLFKRIVYQSWESAEPGIIFYDRINQYNPFLKHLGPLTATNPCGELLLYSNESCNLGSINLWGFIKTNSKEKRILDWESLAKAVRLGTRFLDNVIDVNRYPTDKIEAMTMNTRKIGLGIMGLADLLFELEIPYNQPAGFKFMEELMEFINYHSKLESMELAEKRGVFPYFEKSFYAEGRLPIAGFENKKSWHFEWDEVAKKIQKDGVRNSVTTVIAPTGSISMIGGTSSGIEPIFALVFQKNTPIGSFYYVDPVFEKAMMREGLLDDDLIKAVLSSGGSVQKISYIPPKLKKIFVTAHDTSAEAHIRVLASFTKWTDSSISKTINFPAEATEKDIESAYLTAYELGVKDISIFRDSSIKDQVLTTRLAKKEDKKEKEEKPAEEHLFRIKDEKAAGLTIYHESAVNRNYPEAVSVGAIPGFNGNGDNLHLQPQEGVKILNSKNNNCTECQI